ncbi:DUF3040 domain-containing protein [Arthrobacter castelli]|uniref:DUF3040 domain-containing protein n=1 Tax=Arthrobacter castelli TaxID=271431 RepID=UPI00040C8860|nr:DUF3040 domain-containing protein [Arthrobacter castelli]
MPLSEHEQKLLEQLERQLQADDPKFASSLGNDRMHALSTRHIVFGALGAVLGLLVLLVGISQQWIIVGVVGFLIMGGGVYWASTQGAKAAKRKEKGSGKSKSQSGFMSNLEDKWEDRRREEP